MFGHHVRAYAFGNGCDAFPAWMAKKHPGKWQGFKRMVGNRADIYLENSFLMLPMVPFYNKWTSYVIRHVNEANQLHIRLDSKLACEELISMLRARSLVWVQLMHPLRVATKSLGVEMTPLKFCEYLQHMHTLATRMAAGDVDFLLDPGFVAFGFAGASPVIAESNGDYRSFYDVAVTAAFNSTFGSDEYVKMAFKLYGEEIVVQLERNSADYLKGGKFEQAVGAERAALGEGVVTNDFAESLFASMDRVRQWLPNTSFFTSSVLAAFSYNRTADWLNQLPIGQQEVITRRAIGQVGQQLARDARAKEQAAAEEGEERRAKRAQAARAKLKNQVKMALSLGDVPLIPSRAAYSSFKDEQNGNKRAILKEIRRQLQLLVLFYGQRRSSLFYFSQKGTDFPFEVIDAQYQKVLAQIESGAIAVDHRSDPSDAVLANRHIFRGGTATSASREALQQEQGAVKEIIAELQGEAAAAAGAAASSQSNQRRRKTKKKKKKRRSKPKDPLIGKQVSMPGAYWHLDNHDDFVGKIIKAAQWPYHGQQVSGYEVRFSDGIELIPTADFADYVLG